MKNIVASLAGIFVFLAFYAHGQKVNTEASFGKVSKKDIELTHYEKDPSAAAVVLFDHALQKTSFQGSAFIRHKRIKIFNKDGYQWGNDLIPLIKTGLDDRIKTLKAATYNLIDGEIRQSMLNDTETYKEQLNNDIKLVRFAMPDVREGSIVEIYYEIENSNIIEWTFQQAIPVCTSDYTFSAALEMNFNFIITGHLSPKVIRSNDYIYGQESNTFHMTMNDVPAFKPEANIYSSDDYISRARFYLTWVKAEFGNLSYRWNARATTWADVPRVYRDIQYSTEPDNIKNSIFLQKIATEISKNCKTPEEQIQALHQYVRNHYTWNKRNSIVTENIRRAYDRKEGSSADINLTLLAMLRYAGIMADPVLISTRENGMVRPDMPTIDQFNNVIIQSSLNGKNIYLDATDKYLPYDFLSLPSSVRLGYVAVDSHAGWVDLTDLSKTTTTTVANLKLESNGKINGSISVEKNGYEASASRKRYKDVGATDYVRNSTNTLSDVSFTDATFVNTEPSIEPFTESFAFETTSEGVTGNYDMIYFNPILAGRLAVNPFIEPERKLPLELDYAKTTFYQAKITIPQGYVVDALPAPKLSILPANAGKFLYNISQNAGVIVLICQLSINQSNFTPEEYPHLREFMNVVLAKQAEQVVLKKIK